MSNFQITANEFYKHGDITIVWQFELFLVFMIFVKAFILTSRIIIKSMLFDMSMVWIFRQRGTGNGLLSNEKIPLN